MEEKRDSIAASIAILTISDSRNIKSDESGSLLKKLVEASGHYVQERTLVPDDLYDIRAVVSAWIANPHIAVILTSGGTGFSLRDNSPEALRVLFDKTMDGFGELFRRLSYESVQGAALQSRCLAGVANKTLIFCLPGSPHACRSAWEIIRAQIDPKQTHCNFMNRVH